MLYRNYKAFCALRPEIKYGFLFTLSSILVMELILKNFPAQNDTFFRAGDIYLKFCYSFTASVIFFYINQHLPKQEKKVRTHQFMHNKIVSITMSIADIQGSLNVIYSADPDELRRRFNEACSKTYIKAMVRDTLLQYPNWEVYLKAKTEKINFDISSLMIVNDVIDGDLLSHLLKIQDSVSKAETYMVQADKRNYKLGAFSGLFSNLDQESVAIGTAWDKHLKKNGINFIFDK